MNFERSVSELWNKNNTVSISSYFPKSNKLPKLCFLSSCLKYVPKDASNVSIYIYFKNMKTKSNCHLFPTQHCRPEVPWVAKYPCHLTGLTVGANLSPHCTVTCWPPLSNTCSDETTWKSYLKALLGLEFWKGQFWRFLRPGSLK